MEVRRDYLAWTPAHGEPDDKDNEIPKNHRHGIQQHSEMLEGKEPSEQSSGEAHTGVGGDRHGVAYESMEKTEREQAGQGK